MRSPGCSGRPPTWSRSVTPAGSGRTACSHPWDAAALPLPPVRRRPGRCAGWRRARSKISPGLPSGARPPPAVDCPAEPGSLRQQGFRLLVVVEGRGVQAKGRGEMFVTFRPRETHRQGPLRPCHGPRLALGHCSVVIFVRDGESVVRATEAQQHLHPLRVRARDRRRGYRCAPDAPSWPRNDERRGDGSDSALEITQPVIGPRPEQVDLVGFAQLGRLVEVGLGFRAHPLSRLQPAEAGQ